MPYEHLRGQTAYISGGSSGINLGIAQLFAAKGIKVAIQGRKQDKIDVALHLLGETGTDCAGFSADVRDYTATQTAITQAAETLGPLSIVVAGAAGNFVSPAAQMSAKGFESVVDIDLKGSFNVFRAAFEHAAETASFIAISAPQSVAPYPMQAHVNAAKAGVDHLVRSLAVEWGPRGIRVNAISPGPIADTEGMRRLSPSPEIAEKMAKALPLGRFGQAEEIAKLALFLSSQDAAYITGALIPCDGGTALMGAALFGFG